MSLSPPIKRLEIGTYDFITVGSTLTAVPPAPHILPNFAIPPLRNAKQGRFVSPVTSEDLPGIGLENLLAGP